MSAFHDNALIGASGQQGYKISRSVRLRSSASAYLNRTPASAGDRQKFTISFWMKRGTIGTLDLFTGNNANGFLGGFRSDNTLYLYDAGAASGGMQIWSQRVFRDPSAWYHIVIAVDTTQATDSNRFKVYINGIQETISTWNVGAGASRYPSLNANFDWNNTNSHEIGYALNYGYFDGYFTEFNNVSGQQLDPSSFGETDAVTGVWKPKKYTGTYGTNGFYLNFSDNSGATATTIGKDYSGNGNNWTPNNISVTAGVTYDSMLDSPTNSPDGIAYGRGNYPTFNPLTAGGLVTFSEANLKALSTSASAPYNIESTIKTATTGKWYAEVTMAVGASSPAVGIGNNPSASSSNTDQFTAYRVNGTYITSGMGASSTGTPATFTTNNVIGIAYDADAGTLVFYKDGTLQTGGFTGITAGNYSFIVRKDSASGDGGYLNCGQRPFAYTPPTGFVALNTQNLPTPTISNGANYMAATTYTGTGSALTIANTVGSASFQPDLVWVKGRSGATDHAWYDAVRGVQKQLESNNTAAETTETTGLTAFGSTGFTVGALAQMNTNAATYVGWQWSAGGSTVTNTSGSISAQVRANTTAGFSVVTYTGTGTAATIGHGLGVAPSMMIIKSRPTASTSWIVYHSSISPTNLLTLQTTAAQQNLPLYFNSTAPTSSVFSIGSAANTGTDLNVNGSTYVAYCFAAVAGYSAFGSYTGNASTDGTFVYLGFEPRWVMIKRTDTTGDWQMYDTSRAPINVASNTLYANGAFAEDSNTTNRALDLLSNGFKLRSSASFLNASGGTYIYAAFAEVPFKSALGR